MKCRQCSSKNTRVTCTEHYPTFTKRYCRCLDCKAKFRTIEQYQDLKPGPPLGTPRTRNISRGESHGNVIFKECDIRLMRTLFQQGETLKFIAHKYGTSPSYVSKIVNYKAWTHIQ